MRNLIYTFCIVVLTIIAVLAVQSIIAKRSASRQAVQPSPMAPLADAVLSGLDAYFAKTNIVECGQGRESPVEDFDVPFQRLKRHLPPGTDPAIDAFLQEAASAFAKLKVLCGFAALRKLQEAKYSIEEIYQHRDRATEIFKTQILRSTKATTS